MVPVVYYIKTVLPTISANFIAQVERHTGITEVMASNPVDASDFFLGFVCNCLSYFTTAKITFTSISAKLYEND